MECGIVLDNQNIWLLFEEKEKEEQEIPSNIPRKRKFGEKNTYKRRVHFMERFSQFFGKEPDLDYEDKKIIKKYHSSLFVLMDGGYNSSHKLLNFNNSNPTLTYSSSV